MNFLFIFIYRQKYPEMPAEKPLPGIGKGLFRGTLRYLNHFALILRLSSHAASSASPPAMTIPPPARAIV